MLLKTKYLLVISYRKKTKSLQKKRMILEVSDWLLLCVLFFLMKPSRLWRSACHLKHVLWNSSARLLLQSLSKELDGPLWKLPTAVHQSEHKHVFLGLLKTTGLFKIGGQGVMMGRGGKIWWLYSTRNWAVSTIRVSWCLSYDQNLVHFFPFLHPLH